VTRHGFEESVGSALWHERQRQLRKERLERERVRAVAATHEERVPATAHPDAKLPERAGRGDATEG
jgi:hypothetical protein